MIDRNIKVYFVESTDLYGDRSIVNDQGFFEESQADKLEKESEAKYPINYSFLVQDIYIKFSHRNGESISPEIDGFYWVEYLGQWTIEQNPLNDPDPTIERCHFWGPIPMPMPEGI